MTTKTFTNSAGGSWETAGNWTPSGVPGLIDDALINQAGTYTVTIGAIESPNSVTLNDANATLAISASGQILGSGITLNAGTLAPAGIIQGSVIVNNGGVFTPAGGTLDGVTWQGAFGGPGASFQTVNIKDGITVLNLAGNAPGTIDIGSLYMVNVMDSTPLANVTVNFHNFNIEYLNGPASAAMTIGSTGTLLQSDTGGEGEITGATLTNNGTIDATGSGSTLFVVSTAFTNAGTLIATGGDHVTVNVGFNNTGSVSVSAAGKLSLATSSNTILTNSGTIGIASAGSLIVSGSLSGAGVITMANFGVADMLNTANTETFLDGKGTLRLEAPGSFGGTIAGFQNGDKIDLVATPVTKLSYAGTSSSGVLSVINNGTTVAALNLLGNYSTPQFGFGADGTTGNNITISCFVAGTRILTAKGEVPVESLREGDLLPAQLSQGPLPVVWIGHRRVDCRRHPRPEAVWPVRVAAGALAPRRPHRTLWLSPDHAVFVDDVLIPIKLLINGTSIAQVRMDTVTYYHVELPHHDVLLAEGLPAETYLDTGDRAGFANGGGVVALHPDFGVSAWDTMACAPLILTGPRLALVKRRVNARARTAAAPTDVRRAARLAATPPSSAV